MITLHEEYKDYYIMYWSLGESFYVKDKKGQFLIDNTTLSNCKKWIDDINV